MEKDKKVSYEGAIAIDLGTTNSVMSYITKEGKVELIPNKDGGYLTPSFIWIAYVQGVTKFRVGQRAKEKMLEDPQNVLSSYKTHMGENLVLKQLLNTAYTAQHCSSIVLRYLKESAEMFLGTIVTKAVISVPAYFSEKQKEATKRAAKAVGLEVLRLVPEPTAAAFHYLALENLDKDEERTIMAYDLGGGTFDVSIMNIKGLSSNVSALSGDNHLGGDDIDKSIAQLVLLNTGNKPLVSLKNTDFDTYEKLLRYCELAKIKLTTGETKYTINLEEVGLPKVPSYTITKEQVTEVIEPLIERTIYMVDEALQKGYLEYSDIDDILLVGGSSRLPLIREKLIKLFGVEKYNENYFKEYLIDPDLCVGLGAGKYMKLLLEGNENLVSDIVAKPIGVKEANGDMSIVVKDGSILPSKGVKSYSNGFDGQKFIELEFYEGFSRKAEDNLKLGEIKFSIPESGKGEYTVVVKISVDKDSTLNITVMDDEIRNIVVKRDIDFDDVEKFMKDNKNSDDKLENSKTGVNTSMSWNKEE